MTVIPSTEQFWGVDSYLARAFPLNSDGSIKAVDDTVYEGLEIDGTRDFNLSPADGSVVVNVGNGRLRDTIYRAPRDASTAELLVGYGQSAVKAALSGVKTYTVGEMLAVARLTNQQGSEPDVAMLVTQRGHNQDGLTRFRTYFLPKARVIPRDSSLNDNASQESFQITMSNTKKLIWGTALSVATHGVTDLTYEEYISELPVKVVGWVGDAIQDTFLLPTAKPAQSTDKLSVFNFTGGTEYTSGITKSVSQVVFAYPPAVGDVIVAVYEHAE
jgi:hypothetical protein